MSPRGRARRHAEDVLKKVIVLGFLGFGAVVVSGAFGGGCNNDTKCVTECNRANQCSGAKQQTCTTVCASFDNADSKGICDTEYNALFDCETNQTDTDFCSGKSTACSTQLVAQGNCVNQYCETNPALCATSGFGGAGGSSSGTTTTATASTTTGG